MIKNMGIAGDLYPEEALIEAALRRRGLEAEEGVESEAPSC